MTYTDLLIVDLLHNQKISQAVILSDDFAEALNITTKEPSLNDKTNALTSLKDKGYIKIDDNGYIGLTQKGGKLWERTFLIDWRCYFEYGGEFLDKEYTFFYAVHKKTVELAIKESQGLFDNCTIKTAKNWQPIYWKPPFDGYYIKTPLDSERLPYFNDILPNYCKAIEDFEE